MGKSQAKTETEVELEQRFFRLCTQVVEDNALELYHLEYRESSGRLLVMIQDSQSGEGNKAKTASIEHCVQIDRALTPFIHQEQWMPEKLTLEVSSPGLDRPLVSRWHFEQSIGERIILKLKKRYQIPLEHRKVHCDLAAYHQQHRLKGTLQGVGDCDLQLEVVGVKLEVPMDSIETARWDVVV